MSQQKFFFILASFLLLLVTSGCRRDFSEIVLDDTCKPPCWRNYQIGMSTEEVLNKTLESNDYRIRYEEFNETTASVIIDNGNQGEITLRLDHGKLRGVRFGSFKGFGHLLKMHFPTMVNRIMFWVIIYRVFLADLPSFFVTQSKV